MANKTTNYNLTKPLPSEFYDIEVHNSNMDIIDEELKALDSASASAKTTLVDADTVPLNDSADSNKLKKITWANVKTVLANVFAAKSHTHTKSQISDFPTSIAPSAHASSHKTGGSDALSASDIGAVPTSRTVNGKALSSNITLSASDVGLGNVPNVATNNQTPTYSQASSLANIASGEKLSVSMGKIMKAIADLISHLSNKSNPHGVTASQISAVPTSRTVNGKALSSNVSLSASDVGAVSKNEDITIQKSGAAYDSIFGQGARNALMRVRNVAGNASNQRTIALFDSTQRPDLETAVRLYDVVNGSETIYSLFGEHNLDKLSTALGAAKIQTGSYKGTGTYGSANPVRITCNFVPKAVIVTHDGADGTSGYEGFNWYGQTTGANNRVYSLSGTTLSCYSTQDERYQANNNAYTYRWVAFG